MCNKRQALEELLGYPVTDWSEAQVESEFFWQMEDKNHL